jgi:uncharacterized MnhB-related membrane protein
MRLGVLAMIAILATRTVTSRDPAAQSVAVSAYGLVLSAFFFLMQAPDVALSQLVVGAVVLPLIALLAIARIRKIQARKSEEERS